MGGSLLLSNLNMEVSYQYLSLRMFTYGWARAYEFGVVFEDRLIKATPSESYQYGVHGETMHRRI